jgi:NADH dehydrogenase
MKDTKHHIVIVGGGFGGVKTALELCRNEEFHVTLVSDQPHFRYNPTLYHTATGGAFRQSFILLKDLFRGSEVRLVQGELTNLDRNTQSIELKDGTVLSYDTLVLALGSVTNYFNIPGMQEHSYGIKSLQEITRFKQHLHMQIDSDKHPDLNYLIVGGGPTGIELAGMLPHYIKDVAERHGSRTKKVNVWLIEAAPHLLPRSHKTISKAVAKRLRRLGVKITTGKAVQGVDDDSLIVGDKDIPSKTIIWTAGTSNHPFFKKHDFSLNERGKVVVDNHLLAEKNIYVIGDNADTPYSGMAQTALYDAQYVVHDIEATYHGNKGSVYIPKKPGYVIPIGYGWAAFEMGRWHFSGRLGWIMRQAGDWIGYTDIEPWWRATDQMLSEYDHEEDCSSCSNNESNK